MTFLQGSNRSRCGMKETRRSSSAAWQLLPSAKPAKIERPLMFPLANAARVFVTDDRLEREARDDDHEEPAQAP
jgi:hypothetical protein